jgi:hypothetical protein
MKTKARNLLIAGTVVLFLLAAGCYLFWRFNVFSLKEEPFSQDLSPPRLIKDRFPAPEEITPNFIEIGYLSVISDIGGVSFYYFDESGKEQWRKLLFEKYSFCWLDEEDYCYDVSIPHGRKVQLVGLEGVSGEVVVIEIQKID